MQNSITIFMRSSFYVAAAAKSLQSYPTLCNPIDGSPPGSPVPGILQARTLEWVAISFSNAWEWKAKVKSLSRVRLLATPWTAAYQAPLSMGFSRQEYWSGLPLPSPLKATLSYKCFKILPYPTFNIIFWYIMEKYWKEFCTQIDLSTHSFNKFFNSLIHLYTYIYTFFF